MGYTHYFTFKKAKRGQTKQVEALYQQAVRECTFIIRAYRDEFKGTEDSLSGFSAHAPINAYSGIDFNGKGDLRCENFCLPKHYNDLFQGRIEFEKNESFNFCKTRQYPYDKVVTACLIVFKAVMGDLIDVESDGQAADWLEGLRLAETVLKRKFVIPVGGKHLKMA